ARIPLRHLLFVTIIELVGDQAEVFQREEMRDYLLAELVQALNVREPEVQLAALHGLRLIGNTRATGALLSFLESHGAGEEELEAAVLHALSQIGDEDELLQAARNGSERVALLCIDALSTRQVTHAVPALSQLILNSENREIRRAALVAIGRLGLEESGEPAVLAALQDYSGYVRKEAARIVADRRIQDAGPALWSRLDHEPYPDVLVEQVRAIVNLECQNRMTILQGLLEHHRPEVREAAITHWPDIHDPAVRQLLDDHVDDSDWHVRLSIVERLVVEQDESLLVMFIAASSDPHPYVRQAAMQALGQFPGEAVCVTLRTAVIKDPDMWVRTRAVEQLVKLHDVDACQMLTYILQDSPVPLQIAIVKALGVIGNSSVVEILREMQSHEESEIEEAAFTALRQLTTPIAPPEVSA
ncbi:MAG: HEAT repeat domain-containing protein, partial [Nitrospirae bacterium]|nr:HEAT repeat domain-containing protein [Nitrospirota bacterium]